jgi:hypothetical protein
MSDLEETLALQMRAVGLPEFQQQFKFCPAVAVGLLPFTMGKDYEKLNAAQELGIKVLLYTGEQVKDGTAIAQLERIFK